MYGFNLGGITVNLFAVQAPNSPTTTHMKNFSEPIIRFKMSPAPVGPPETSDREQQ